MSEKASGSLREAMLSVLIVNWNTATMLRACLRSLSEYSPSIPTEIIVVDNDSIDGSAELVRTEFPEVTLVTPGFNTGYARGNNLAFQHAKGEWLLTLNPDTEFVDSSLQRAVDILSSKPQVGCLAARLVGPDRTVQASVRGFPTVFGVLCEALGLGRIFPGTALDSYRLRSFDYTKESNAPQPMGTFLLFRRHALEAVGDPSRPFDEAFPIFFNDVDLLARLRRAGWTCLYSPEISVLHHGGMSTKQVRKSMIWESHRSLARYLWKHRSFLWDTLLVPIAGVLIYGAAVVRARGFDAGFRSHR